MEGLFSLNIYISPLDPGKTETAGHVDKDASNMKAMLEINHELVDKPHMPQ